MTHQLSIHSMLHFLAILFCLFPTIIYSCTNDHDIGQIDANHLKDELHADHPKGQLNANHDNDQLHAKHDKGQLKIRFHNNKEHAYVVIGDHYEYDYMDTDPPRRRIVRKDKVDATKPEDRAKTMRGNANKEFDVAKADKIFYELVTQEGWVKENFDWDVSRFCRSFVYEFVCKLFNGECPKQEEWPEEFVEVDLEEPESVFKPAYKDARKHFKKVKNESGCHLEEIELKIKVVGKMDLEMLPSIVQIITGKVDPYGDDWASFDYDSFETEEWVVKVDGHENEFKTKIKVFICPGGHFYFRTLIIFDEKKKWEILKISGSDLKEYKDKVLQIDLSKATKNVRQHWD